MAEHKQQAKPTGAQPAEAKCPIYEAQFHALLHHTALREGRLHGLMVPCALASESSGLSVGCLRAVCTPVWQV